MKDKISIRKQVEDAYANAVSSPSMSECCSPEPVQKGVIVKMAGYSSNELGELPPEAVINSFGCGNPVAFAGMKEGDTILDLGSGAGIDLFLAARKVGAAGRVIGVDMTDEMIARARENISESEFSNIEVRKGIIEEMPVEDSSIDWIISNCVINLSPEKHRVFAEMARVLRPGGQVLVSDIIVDGLPEWVMADSSLYNSCIAGAIGEKEYLDGMKQAGLEAAQIRDRLIYEPMQLMEFFESELSEGISCCPEGRFTKEQMKQVAEELAGKVCSALIYAVKPVISDQ